MNKGLDFANKNELFYLIMNVSSLYLHEILIMDSSVLVKYVFLIPLFLFVDYLLMILFGCATWFLGCGNDFYCGTYCLVGKIVLVTTMVFIIFLIFTDIKSVFKKL
jgi:hypothetical protein